MLLALTLSLPVFSQYKIHSQTISELRQKTLAIVVDQLDSAGNARVKDVFSQYWNLNQHIILCNSQELPDLMKTGEFVFLRHQARISTDEKTQVSSRTDYLSLFTNEFLEDDIALCYTNTGVMPQNLLNLKFYIKALQQAVLLGEETDSANVRRNIEGLAELRHHTLFISADLLGTDGLKAGLTTDKAACRLKAKSYAYQFAVVTPAELNTLSTVDSIPVFTANVVNMPDHQHYLYICEVNTGRIIYKNIVDAGCIRQVAFQALNHAIMNSCLQGKLSVRQPEFAGR